jgi:hypothetical protein
MGYHKGPNLVLFFQCFYKWYFLFHQQRNTL